MSTRNETTVHKQHTHHDTKTESKWEEEKIYYEAKLHSSIALTLIQNLKNKSNTEKMLPTG